MNIISVQPITDRPIIDAIAPDDFMLIGDASDNNVVKRVLVSSLKTFFAASSTSPSPSPQPFALRVNCAGNQYLDSAGKTWLADFGFTGGQAGGDPNGGGDPVAGTLDSALYQNDRYGTFSYSFAVTSGQNYTINLLFSDGYTAPNQRVSRIKADGITRLDNFDVVAEAGFRTALIKTLAVTATSNVLTISTEPILAAPYICAIEILGS